MMITRKFPFKLVMYVLNLIYESKITFNFLDFFEDAKSTITYF